MDIRARTLIDSMKHRLEVADPDHPVYRITEEVARKAIERLREHTMQAEAVIKDAAPVIAALEAKFPPPATSSDVSTDPTEPPPSAFFTRARVRGSRA